MDCSNSWKSYTVYFKQTQQKHRTHPHSELSVSITLYMLAPTRVHTHSTIHSPIQCCTCLVTVGSTVFYIFLCTLQYFKFVLITFSWTKNNCLIKILYLMVCWSLLSICFSYFQIPVSLLFHCQTDHKAASKIRWFHSNLNFTFRQLVKLPITRRHRSCHY